MTAQKDKPTTAKDKPEPDEKEATTAAPEQDTEQLVTAGIVAAANEKKARAAELQTARDELLRKLAAVDQAAADEGLGTAAVPSHLLVLVDGSRVECAGAVPTHYAHSDGRVLPVVSVHSLEGLTANA